MSRLIAISNRVAVPKAGKSAGGLAVGVLAALAEHGGVWFGWSGKTTDSEPGDTKRTQSDNIEFVTIDLNADDFEAYYNGFSNNSLWPLLHFMLGYFSFRRSQYAAYCRVNEFFSRRLISVIEKDDLIWVHDYHLFPLGANLRQAHIFLGYRVEHQLACLVNGQHMAYFQTIALALVEYHDIGGTYLGDTAIHGNHVAIFNLCFRCPGQ